MAALPLNTAPHFVFFYRFCNFHDFYCALHQKNCFYHFQGHFVIIKEFFFKIQGQFKDKVHFFRIPGVFQDQGHFQGLFKVCANPVKPPYWICCYCLFIRCLYIFIFFSATYYHNRCYLIFFSESRSVRHAQLICNCIPNWKLKNHTFN